MPDEKLMRRIDELERLIRRPLGPEDIAVTEPVENDLTASDTEALVSGEDYRLTFTEKLHGRMPRYILIQPSIALSPDEINYIDKNDRPHRFWRGLAANEILQIEFPSRWKEIYGNPSATGILYWYIEGSTRDREGECRV